MNSFTALASPLAAGLALATGLVGILGPRFGLIEPLAGFVLFGLVMPVILLAALLLGLIGLLRTRQRHRRGGASQAWGGVLLSLAVLGPFLVLGYDDGQTPPIHDITTSTDDPPIFEAAADQDSRGRAFAYPSGGARVPDLQRQAYPDLRTLRLDVSAVEAEWRIRRAAGELGWELLHAEAGSGRFEFSDATPWFRFVDFVAVRVRPDGNGAAIDVRSVSRFGVGDLGKNAARIRRFLEHLDGSDQNGTE